MVINIFKNLLLFISEHLQLKKSEWKKVRYPPSLPKKFFGFIPTRIILLISIICLESIIIANISDKIHSNIGQFLMTLIFIFIIYKTIIIYCKRFKGMKQEGNKRIEKDLQYLIHSLKLYEEVGSDKEKRIVRAIKMYYKVENDKKIFVKILKIGDKYTQISSTLSSNLESSLSCKLESFHETINYCLYTFNREELKQFVFSNTIPLDKTFLKIFQWI